MEISIWVISFRDYYFTEARWLTLPHQFNRYLHVHFKGSTKQILEVTSSNSLESDPSIFNIEVLGGKVYPQGVLIDKDQDFIIKLHPLFLGLDDYKNRISTQKLTEIFHLFKHKKGDFDYTKISLDNTKGHNLDEYLYYTLENFINNHSNTFHNKTYQIKYIGSRSYISEIMGEYLNKNFPQNSNKSRKIKISIPTVGEIKNQYRNNLELFAKQIVRPSKTLNAPSERKRVEEIIPIFVQTLKELPDNQEFSPGTIARLISHKGTFKDPNLKNLQVIRDYIFLPPMRRQEIEETEKSDILILCDDNISTFRTIKHFTQQLKGKAKEFWYVPGLITRSRIPPRK